jgi:hypothetical protein
MGQQARYGLSRGVAFITGITRLRKKSSVRTLSVNVVVFGKIFNSAILYSFNRSHGTEFVVRYQHNHRQIRKLLPDFDEKASSPLNQYGQFP